MTEYEFTDPSNARKEFPGALAAWESYRNHREIVTGLLRDAMHPHAESLCILGAGRCQDVDVRQLLRHFGAITLSDLNERDLQLGLRHQQVESEQRIQLRGGVDISGVHDLLEAFCQQRSQSALDQLIETAASYRPPLGRYDVIASTGLLSQLLCHATECVGESHGRFVDVLQVIRQRHIEIMVEQLRPRGVGLLITDFVSSVSLPELMTTRNLKATVQNALVRGNFLHGLNPAMVGQVFKQPSIQRHIRSIKISDPWRWVMPDRIYACFAIVFSRRDDRQGMPDDSA